MGGWIGAMIEDSLFAGTDTLVFTDQERGVMTVPADGSAAPALLAGLAPNVPTDPLRPPTFWVLRDGRVVVQDGTGLVLLNARGGGTPLRLVDGGGALLSCE